MNPTSEDVTVCPSCQGRNWRRLYRRQDWDFLACHQCGLVRIDPIPTDEQLIAHYRARFESGNYEPEKAAERQATLRGIFDQFASIGPGRIFDVGCFDGGLLDIAQDAGWETWGIEYQGQAVDIARSKHPGRIVVGPLETFKAPDMEFDVVTAIGLIEHLRQPERLAEFASSILRRHGLLVLQTPDYGSLLSRMLGRYWPPIAPPEHIWYFKRSNVTQLLEASGFDAIRIHTHFKPLRVGYVYEQLGVFGPELQRLARPLHRIPWLMDRTLPMYGGEMILTAVRS